LTLPPTLASSATASKVSVPSLLRWIHDGSDVVEKRALPPVPMTLPRSMLPVPAPRSVTATVPSAGTRARNTGSGMPPATRVV
jgi:hypothetical protein